MLFAHSHMYTHTYTLRTTCFTYLNVSPREQSTYLRGAVRARVIPVVIRECSVLCKRARPIRSPRRRPCWVTWPEVTICCGCFSTKAIMMDKANPARPQHVVKGASRIRATRIREPLMGLLRSKGAPIVRSVALISFRGIAKEKNGQRSRKSVIYWTSPKTQLVTDSKQGGGSLSMMSPLRPLFELGLKEVVVKVSLMLRSWLDVLRTLGRGLNSVSLGRQEGRRRVSNLGAIS